jgi:hypothetical protein
MTSMFELRYEDRRGGLVKDFYEQWRIDYLAAHPRAPIENIRFEHDPNWRSAWFSVQHTRNDIIVPLTAWYAEPIKAVWCPLEYRVGEYLFWVAHEKSQARKPVRVNATGPKLRLRSRRADLRETGADCVTWSGGNSQVIQSACPARPTWR